jgi:hypothetical protein
MEANCEDKKSLPTSPLTSPDPMDKIQQLFTSLSAQIERQNLNLSWDFCQLVQDNTTFKQEVHEELDEIRQMLYQRNVSNLSSSSMLPTVPNLNLHSVSQEPSSTTNQSTSHPIPQGLSSSMASSSSTDMQTQMMYLLTELFSKLSTALLDKSSDTKSEWPKSGDSTKFWSWYLAIIVQLSLPPWQELYDSIKHDVVSSMSNAALNGKLYAKLLLSLEGIASQNIISRTHLRGNGVLLLQELVQTYHPKNVLEVIAAKTSQFWDQTKHLSNESIDTYYNRFHELLQELLDGEETISTKSAIRHFLFPLGPQFETIQNNFHICNLPTDWNTTDWLTFLILYRDYYNSVKPQGLPWRDSSNNLNSTFDCAAHQKKVKEWSLSPIKFFKKIADEQAKYQGKCLYHLTKSHQTCKCHVLKEGDKTGNSTTNSGQASGTGQLWHITEDLVDDIVDASLEDKSGELGNDTNDESLQYFARVSNHYLHLVKSSPKEKARHDVKFPIITDSGSNYHMFKELVFFDSLVPATGWVILGDGKTSLPIHGIGTIRLMIDGNELLVDNVRCIPELSESIYSLFLHLKCPNHGLQSSYDHGLHISFPTFTTQAVLGEHDIYLNAVPGNTTIKCPSFLPSTSTSFTKATSPICSHIKDASSVLCTESTRGDNILTTLWQYYDDIKTKRQLNLELPASFHHEGYFQCVV